MNPCTCDVRLDPRRRSEIGWWHAERCQMYRASGQAPDAVVRRLEEQLLRAWAERDEAQAEVRRLRGQERPTLTRPQRTCSPEHPCHGSCVLHQHCMYAGTVSTWPADAAPGGGE